MQTDLRRIHGAAPHCERDHAHRDPELRRQRGDAFDDVKGLGGAGVGAGEPGQPMRLGSAVAAWADRQRHRRRVQQPVGGRTDHHLPEAAVSRRTQHQRFGFQLLHGGDQAAGCRAVSELVEAHLERGVQGRDAPFRFGGRVGRESICVLGVLGVDACGRRRGPRLRDDGDHRERCLECPCGFHPEVQCRNARSAGQVSDYDGHDASFGGWMSTSSSCGTAVGMRPSPPSLSALWCLPQMR